MFSLSTESHDLEPGGKLSMIFSSDLHSSHLTTKTPYPTTREDMLSAVLPDDEIGRSCRVSQPGTTTNLLPSTWYDLSRSAAFHHPPVLRFAGFKQDGMTPGLSAHPLRFGPWRSPQPSHRLQALGGIMCSRHVRLHGQSSSALHF